MSELEKLQNQRDELVRQIDDLDARILVLKQQRKDELLAELKALGLDNPQGGASRKGRPRGFALSEEHKAKLREGRERARRAKQEDSSEQPQGVASPAVVAT